MKYLSVRFAVLVGALGILNPMSRAEPTVEEMEGKLLEMQTQMMEMQNQMEALHAQLVAMQERKTEVAATESSAPPAPVPATTAATAPASTSKYPLKFYGKVKVDGIYDSNTLGTDEFILFVPQDADGQSQVSFTARETRLGFSIGGPTMGDWRTTAKIESDFYGSALSGGSGSLRIRLAYVDLTNGKTAVRVGQDWLPISTLNPSTTNFTIMAYNGNLWNRIPQVTVRQKFSENVTGLVSAYRFRDGEDTEHGLETDLLMPWVAAGLRFHGDPFGTGKKASVAINGAFRSGEVEGESVTPSLVSAEFDLPWRAVSLKGEVYYGEGLGAEYLHRGGAFNLNGKPIRTSGGFLQLGIRVADPVRLNFGYGLDNPRDEDLVADEFYRKSTTLFGNAYYDLTSDLMVVVEGSQVKTTWSDGTKDGFRFQSSLIFVW
ncbi:MAG: hypothetical protein DRP71_12200 [Verrucomicrobia bacterium]|nr:MAG: hypothetical protein DRP71_12200 [Verrucomicrobiota bacterium]